VTFSKWTCNTASGHVTQVDKWTRENVLSVHQLTIQKAHNIEPMTLTHRS